MYTEKTKKNKYTFVTRIYKFVYGNLGNVEGKELNTPSVFFLLRYKRWRKMTNVETLLLVALVDSMNW